MLFINYDCVLYRDLVINTNTRVGCVNPEEFSGDLVVIVQTFQSFSINKDEMSFTRRLSLSWTTLSRTMGAEVRMGPPEEELEVELLLEEDDEEEIFILGKGTKKYLKQKWY